MDKYYGMKNPPRFTGEWKYYAFYIFDIITVLGFMLLAHKLNVMFHIPLFLAFFHYIFWFIFAIFLIYRPIRSPGQRQFFVIIESLFFSDRNNYHVIDPNRKYGMKEVNLKR